MNTATRLGAFGAGLAVVFGGVFVAADALVPQSTVDEWTGTAKGHDMSNTSTNENTEGDMSGMSGMDHGGQGSSTAAGQSLVPGVTSAQNGYLLSPVTAPGKVDNEGTLSFAITDADGNALTDYTVSHEKDLHLIVVRSDGALFRHVHPTLDAAGTWSIPWQWEAAGTYRVYADFVPGDDEDAKTTLTRTVEVAGDFAPVRTEVSSTAKVDGLTIELNGELTAGAMTDLSFTITRDGKPVTNLQPYLGAFGHLVALREGDMAYLHVHPEGDEPQPGDESGPQIDFMAEAPTPGRYLLYLDFQIDGTVHSAPFVVDTTGKASATDTSGESGGSGDGHDGH